VGFKYEFGSTSSKSKPRRNLNLPEVQLMALIVIATKLLFPFDDLDRQPSTAKEPATQFIDWSLWARAQTHFNNRENSNGRIDKEQVIQLTDKDVLNMGSSQLDQYMDWYESSWIDSFRLLNPVADMFPTSRTTEVPGPSQAVPPSTLAMAANTEEALNSLVHTVMQELKANEINQDPEEDDCRPGSWYWRYRWESQLPETAKAFYELAAQLAAVSLQTLVNAVTVTEHRIAKTIEDKRRAEYFSQMMELDMEGDADEDSADGMDELDEQLTELNVGMEP
jgi:RNA polymerase I-specific transcription initiation factor RRN7